jgi:signal transduction histidine kinase
MNIRRLRTVTILGPILFLLLIELVGIVILRPALGENSLVRLVIVFSVLTAAVVPFSFWVFAIIERQQRDLVRSHAELQAWSEQLERIVAERTREIERYSRETTTRVFQAQEEERKRIARELHDDTAQSLSSLLITLDLLEPAISHEEDDVHANFDRIRSIAKRALDEVRALSHDLRPTILDDFGLEAALKWYADEYTATFGVPVSVDIEAAVHPPLEPEVELALFRIAQEALTNSGKYANASRVTLTLAFPNHRVELEIADNGRGFDLDDVRQPSRHGGLGLYGMRERAELLGANLAIESAPGKGTKVTAVVPLSAPEAVAVGYGEESC